MDTPKVVIVRSRRRKKTIQTKYGEGTLWIYLPAGMLPNEEQTWVNRMMERNERWKRKQSLTRSDEWLTKRAQMLNKQYFDGTLSFSIRFVENQQSRFGSCTSVDRTIRISDRVKTMPTWVQDYVIVHELTHLIYPDHSKKFWEMVNHYPFAERAKGYLIAKGADGDPGQTE